MTPMSRLIAVAALTLLAAAPAGAQAPMLEATRTVPVRFARGAASATVQGRVQGYETVDYVLGARRGQRLTASMRTSNSFAYFTVLAPGDQTAPEGGAVVKHYSGVLTNGGDWRVRVYLMRNAARRGARADYDLTLTVR